MIESDFTAPPSDTSPESIAAFDLRRRAYTATRAAYASIPLAIDRPDWDHLGAETRATMAAAVLAVIDPPKSITDWTPPTPGELPDEAPCWLIWEKATDGGRPYLRAIDTSEAMCRRHLMNIRMESKMLDNPPPDLVVEESKLNHLYASNIVAAVLNRRHWR